MINETWTTPAPEFNSRAVHCVQTGGLVAMFTLPEDARIGALAPEMLNAIGETVTDIQNMVGDRNCYSCELRDLEHPWHSTWARLRMLLDRAGVASVSVVPAASAGGITQDLYEALVIVADRLSVVIESDNEEHGEAGELDVAAYKRAREVIARAEGQS